MARVHTCTHTSEIKKQKETGHIRQSVDQESVSKTSSRIIKNSSVELTLTTRLFSRDYTMNDRLTSNEQSMTISNFFASDRFLSRSLADRQSISLVNMNRWLPKLILRLRNKQWTIVKNKKKKKKKSIRFDCERKHSFMSLFTISSKLIINVWNHHERTKWWTIVSTYYCDLPPGLLTFFNDRKRKMLNSSSAACLSVSLLCSQQYIWLVC